MNRRSTHPSTDQRRRATVAPFIAVMLVVLLGFVALGVDVGYIYTARGEMQKAVDASALAGASALMLDDQQVRDRAIEFAGRNPVVRAPVAEDELSIVVGNWDGRYGSFVPLSGAETVRPNAVHVTGARPDIPLYFAPVIGIDTTNVRKEAIAVAGAGLCAGIWGLEGVTCDGNLYTDSYDSTAGPYWWQGAQPNGDVCSCRDIMVNGGIEIHGDAMYGQEYAFIPEGISYEVWGLIDDHVCGVPSYNADFAAAAANNDNATIGLTKRGRDPFNGSPWNLYVTGNDGLVLTEGTYYFTSVLIDGQATLVVTGPTTMFVDGPATFTGGGIFNVTEDPKNLLIYCSGSIVNLRGGSGFYGAVVAPEADVIVEGTGDYFGTILARTLDFDGDAVIHVDETLVFELFGMQSVAPALVK